LATVVQAKMSMFLLDCSQSQQAQEVLNCSFEDLLKFDNVDSMINDKLVQALGGDIEGHHDTELSPVSDVDATGSDSSDAGD
jgi:hypothetical protein